MTSPEASDADPSAPGFSAARGGAVSPSIVENGRQILALVEEQVEMGPRVPGTAPHDRLATMLEERLRGHCSEVSVQEFTVLFRGNPLSCRNIVGVFRASTRATEPPPPILLGTHYDTRIRADRETDPALRETPIPGANDGGSGTAVLLHMLPWLAGGSLERDVAIAFFDAEDLGNIDGKEFSLGAAWCADHPPPGFSPREVVALDMVGGREMILDIDAHIMRQPGSLRLTRELFQVGLSHGWEPFTRDKPERIKYIISDHYPFARRGISAGILIDIDYPQWHTLQDTSAAMSEESLGIIEGALSLFLSPPAGRAGSSAGHAGP
jgi:glutaminyl-peptide cyclotransferase